MFQYIVLFYINIVTSVLLRINFSPYLIEIDLKNEINEDDSKAIFKDGKLFITLKKIENELWGDINSNLFKNERKERRNKSIEEKEKKDKELYEKKSKLKSEGNRYALREQMSLEDKERQKLDDLKEEEKKEAEKEVYEALQKLNEKKIETIKEDENENSDYDSDNDDNENENENNKEPIIEEINKPIEKDDLVYIPPPNIFL